MLETQTKVTVSSSSSQKIVTENFILERTQPHVITAAYPGLFNIKISKVRILSFYRFLNT